MPFNSLLSDLLERLQAGSGPTLLIGFDEARQWPEGALSSLTDSGLIAPRSPAKALVCDGCEKGCTMRVRVVPGTHPRAFIMCDDVGRVPVTLDRLQQWQMSEAAVAGVLLAACDDRSITEQLIRDKLPTLPLSKVLSFEQERLRVDLNRLLRYLLPETQTSQPNRFTLTGDHWAITYQCQTRTFNNTLGLRYIAWLIQHQGKEALVAELYYAINPSDGEAIDSTYSAMTADQLDDIGLSVGDLGDAGDALTPEGRRRLENAVQEIQEQIDEANELGDHVKAAKLEQQQEQILGYIAAESGLGGKPRKASSTIERLRKAVTKRIRTDIEKVTETFPDLGHHLNETIRTGTQCQYSPHPPIEWIIELKTHPHP